MSKKTKSGRGSFGSFKGFFNYNLSQADKTAVKKLELDKTAVYSRILDLLESGYKVSVSWPDGRNTYFVTATGKSAPCPNMGRALTMRHSDLEKAVTAVWHVVAVVYDWEEWPADDEYDVGW